MNLDSLWAWPVGSVHAVLGASKVEVCRTRGHVGWDIVLPGSGFAKLGMCNANDALECPAAKGTGPGLGVYVKNTSKISNMYGSLACWEIANSSAEIVVGKSKCM